MTRYLKALSKWLIIISISLCFIIWIFSPLVVKHYLKSHLFNYQLVLSDDTSIRYNPFSTHLTINNLAVNEQDSDKKVLSLDNLELELRLHQILFDELYISELYIDGLMIDVVGENNDFTIAGFNLKKLAAQNAAVSAELPDENTQPEDADNTTQENQPLPYKLIIPEFTLENSLINFALEQQQHKFELNNFSLNDLHLSIAEQNINLSINSKINDASVVIDIAGQLLAQQGEVTITTHIAAIQLGRFKQFLPEQFKAFTSEFSFDATNKITLDKQQLTVNVSELAAKLANSHVATLTEQVFIENVLFTASNIDISLDNFALSQISGNAGLVINNSKVTTDDLKQQLLLIKQTSLPGIEFTLSPEQYQIALPQLNVNNISLMNNLELDDKSMVDIANVAINEIQLAPELVAIASVIISGSNIEIKKDEQGLINNLVALNSQATDANIDTVAGDKKISADTKQLATEPPNEVEENGQVGPFFYLGELKTGDKTSFTFHDKSISPNYLRDFNITEFTLGAIDTKNVDNITKLSLIGKSNKYATLTLNALMTPFAQIPEYAFNGKIREVDLHDISGYMKAALGHEVESGQLDLNIDAKIVGTELAGDTEIILRGIELKGVDGTNVVVKTVVPFGMALNMLKDNDGKVVLDLPLSGDISSPSFGLSGLMTLLVKQATISAAKDYLFTTFVPYASVVKVAMMAGDYALKINVQDLIFTPEIVELNDEQQTFMAQFSALMKDKSDLQVTLCPISVPQDIGLLFDAKLTEQQVSALHNIAKQRATNFKSYLVENQAIESARLLVCKPKVDGSKGSKPRLTFKL
ncbi:MAG: DUF748 domain-containing protein [Thalassotalea sp.]